MNEKVLRNKIKVIFLNIFDISEIEFLNQHGSKYSVVGLPDLLILTPKVNFWLELKRDKRDEPRIVQKYWVEHLRRFGFVTGFVYYDNGVMYKKNWDDKKAIKLEELILRYVSNK